MLDKYKLYWYNDDCEVDDEDSGNSSDSTDNDMMTGWDLLNAIWNVI